MIRLSGRVRSALVIGGQGIRARKLRTLLSMISLFLGVLAVVVVQAAAEFAERAALANVELTTGKDGTLVAYPAPHPRLLPATLELTKERDDVVITIESRTIIGEPRVTPVNAGMQSFDHLAASGPAMDGPSLACDARGCYEIPGAAQNPPGQSIELSMVAISGDLRQFRPFELRSGQWFDFGSAPSLSPGLVLNREAAKGFERYRVPAEMFLDGAPVNATPRIIGVVDDGSFLPTVYVRLDEVLNWLPPAHLETASPKLMLAPEARDTVRILNSRVNGVDADPNQIYIETLDSRDRIGSQLTLLRWIFLGMAALVLLIGVAGILNVGLATVGERVEEFALRRAVGTPRFLLAGIVLTETLLTGLLTAGVAVGVSAAALRFLGEFVAGRSPVPIPTDFPWQAGVAGVLAGLAAGLLGGLIPAIRAARIPIATVMRA